MSLHEKKLSVGALKITIYDFDVIGDVLPEHVHNLETEHISIVARGAIKCTTPDWVQEWTAGRVVDLPAFQPHEFEALEPNTRVINIVKN